MKIFLYLPTPGGLTGAPRRLLTLACGMRDLGAIPVIATEPNSMLMYAAQEASFETIAVPAVGVLALRDRAIFGGGLLFRLRVASALLRQQLRFFRAVRSASANVIWMRGSKSIAFAGLGVVLARRPMIWDVDDELPSRGVVRLLHRAGLALARGVVLQHNAASDIFGEELAKQHAAKISVLVPGIDLKRVLLSGAQVPGDERIRAERFRILQVGTLCDRKNQAFLIEVLDCLPSNIRERVEVWFAGGAQSADYETLLHAEIARRELAANVRFLGWRDDVQALMATSDLLVMPSKSEGVPNTVQEAMALGLPVLCSDRGGFPDVVEDSLTGWIRPLGDPAVWADALCEIIADPDANLRIADQARTYANKNFSNEGWSERYLTLVQAMSKNCSRPS